MPSDVPDFQSLNGEMLGSVCFVMDYVEFNFSGPVFRSLAVPRVSDRHGTLVFPEPGSRDRLCQRIGHLVIDARNDPESLILRFDDDSVIETPKFSPGVGPEIAHFLPVKAGKPVPGETYFYENLAPTRPET